MDDRRKQILEAGLGLLREEGLAGFTQPRIAARTGLRQSHLTYYFPTRTDLLAAVARHAIDMQLAAAKVFAAQATSVPKAAAAIASLAARHDNTRVFAALSQAADQEPEVRALFNRLVDGALGELDSVFNALGLPASEANLDMLHALFVGLAIIDLASGRKHGEARAEAALRTAFDLLSRQTTKTQSARGRRRK
jgi:AcrR family transcriptional regulator